MIQLRTKKASKMEVITLQSTVITEITMRREKYAIKKGDYVRYNGATYQFCAGDGRTLRTERGWFLYDYIILTQKALKTIPLDKMRKTQSGNAETKSLNIKWYF